MLHLHRLGIRGIRSFDPDNSQEIRFMPLTLIVGQNGAGKTTIIESLKFAATGEMPPGCDRGKSFIHDIFLSGESSVDGQIRLAFNDVENKKTTITRSMRTTVKYVKKKPVITFKQVNQVILRDGKSVDQKCVDINNEAVELFGVSRAVLNNVIFCHQEDTNWPLSEGKALKEKFDSIFGSIEHVKALEKLKKTRTDLAKNLKHYEQETENALEWMNEADRIQNELDEEKDNLSILAPKRQKFKEIIAQSSKELEELGKKEQETELHMNELSRSRGRMEALDARIKEFERGDLDYELLSQGRKSLESMIDESDDYVKSLHNEKEKIVKRTQDVRREHQSKAQEREKISQDIGKVGELQRQIEVQQAKRNETISLLNDSHFDTFSRDELQSRLVLDDPSADFLTTCFNNQIEVFDEEFKATNTRIMKKEESLAADLREIHSEASVVKHTITTKEKELEQKISSQKKYRPTESQENSLAALEELEMNIQEQSSRIESLDAEFVQFKQEKSKREERRGLEKRELAQLEEEHTLLKQQVDQASEGFLRQSIEQKKTEKTNIFEKIHSLLPNIEHSNEFLLPGLTEDTTKLGKEISSLQKELAANKLLQEFYNSVITKHNQLSSQISKLKSHFVGVCTIDEFPQFKESKNLEKKASLSRREDLCVILPALEKQLEQVKNDAECPICQNDLKSKWTSKKTHRTLTHTDVIENLTKTIADNRKEFDSFEPESVRMEAELKKLDSLNPFYEQFRSYKIQIAELEDSYNSASTRIFEVDDSIEAQTKSIEDLQSKLDNLNELRFDVKLHDNLVKEINKLTQSIKNSDVSQEIKRLEQLSEKIESKKLFIDSVESQIGKYQKKIEKIHQQKTEVFTFLNVSEKKKQELKTTHDNFKLYEKLLQEIETLKQELDDAKTQHECLAEELPGKEEALKIHRMRSSMYRKKKESECAKLKLAAEQFETIVREVKECDSRLKECFKRTSKDYLNQLQSSMDELDSELAELQTSLDKLNNDISLKQLNLANAKRCFEYLEVKGDRDAQEAVVNSLLEKIQFNDLSSIRQSKSKVSETLSKTQAKLENCSHQIVEYKSRIVNLEKKLSEGKFANASKNYKKCLCVFTMRSMSCNELNKYYKAMDYSITQFHKCKMNEINKLLEKFWKIAYQGKDIKSIKIVSDEEVHSAETARRVYNYRVVMVFDKTEIDMRGRCSAGQKVLASLVIRLALALIFCNNFTVVTLDEPTTNLDKDNIRAFARAITSLMKSNRFFQIIIITHDREFIKCLDSEAIDYYFEVTKNQNGYSQVVRKSVHEDTNIFEQSHATVMNDTDKKKRKVEEDDFEPKPRGAKLLKKF